MFVIMLPNKRIPQHIRRTWPFFGPLGIFISFSRNERIRPHSHTKRRNQKVYFNTILSNLIPPSESELNFYSAGAKLNAIHIYSSGLWSKFAVHWATTHINLHKFKTISCRWNSHSQSPNVKGSSFQLQKCG